jgi:RimJ/RimL family protein N-acetyltransferase
MHTTYSGERVRIRPFKDEAEFVSTALHFAQAPHPYWGPLYESVQSMKKDYEAGGMLNADEYSMFAMDRLDSGELIGFSENGGVRTGCLQSWVGTFIKDEHWGQGFGIESKQLAFCYLFENFPIVRIESATLENHVRAARGLRDCGMHYEGRLRRAVRQNGRWVDIVQYAIFREEWEKLPIRQIVKRG